MENETSLVNYMHQANEQMFVYQLPAIVYTSVMMLIGLPGNFIVFYVYFFKWRRSTSRMFILFLAALDMINCATTLPIEIYIMRFSVMLDNPYLCKFSRFSTYAMNSSSALILLGIAVDRYRRICQPYKKSFSETVSKYICIAVIVITICTTWPSLIMYGTRTIPLKKGSGRACLLENRFDTTPYPMLYFIYMSTMTLAVFTSLTVLYYFVGVQIYKHRTFKMKRCSHVEKIKEEKTEVSENETDANAVGNAIGSVIDEKGESDYVSSDAKNENVEKKEDPSPKTTDKSENKIPNGKTDGEKNGNLPHPSSESLKDKDNKGLNAEKTYQRNLSCDSRSTVVSAQESESATALNSPRRKKRSTRPKRVRYLLVRRSSTWNSSRRSKCPSCTTVRIGRSTLMLFLITIAYVISFLPFYTLIILRQTDRGFLSRLSSSKGSYMAYLLFLRSYLLSSAINPIIYSFCNAQFREYCVDLFKSMIFRDRFTQRPRQSFR